MAKNNNIKGSVKCSFCGKTQENVKRIVAGPGVYICDECIGICKNIIEDEMYSEEQVQYSNSENGGLPNPEQIKKTLDEYVIGPEKAKKTL